VENAKQLDYLIDYRCDFIQGNYFYKPMSAKELLIVQRDSQHYQNWSDNPKLEQCD
jgi:EAL domain-containing protein (putative c-di-GMP-specific phosphodiesterase class I)